VDRAELEHARRHASVVARRERRPDLVDDAWRGDRRRRATVRGCVVADDECSAEGKDDKCRDEEPPLQDGGSIEGFCPVC